MISRHWFSFSIILWHCCKFYAVLRLIQSELLFYTMEKIFIVFAYITIYMENNTYHGSQENFKTV